MNTLRQFSARAVALGLLLCVVTLGVARPASAQEPAPRTAAAQAGGWTLLGFGQLFTDYEVTRGEAQSFNQFTLRRAELGLGFLHEGRHGFVVNLEALRSAGPGSYVGIDDNSLVMRVKHAFGVARWEVGPGEVMVRGGLIPDVWVELVERAYDLRGVQALGFESAQLYDTSDLGASAAYRLWDGRLEARLEVANGEGRNQVELNEGKNTALTLSARPWRPVVRGRAGELGLHGSYRDGSVGFSSRANHRLSGALTFQSPLLFAGFEYGRAMGYLGRGDQRAQLLGGWVSGALRPTWLGVFGRGTLTQVDLEQPDALSSALHVGLYVDLIDAGDAPRDVLGFPRLRLYAGYRRETSSALGAPIAGVPEATDRHALLLTLSARGAASIDSPGPPQSSQIIEKTE